MNLTLSSRDIQTVEDHFHNFERWYGSTAGVGPAVENVFVPWRVTTSGTAGVFGSAIVVFDGTEANKAFQTMYDFRLIVIAAVQTTDTYLLRFSFNVNGEANAAAAIANGHYTTQLFGVSQPNVDFLPIDSMCGQIPKGTKMWCEAARKTTGAAWVDFYAGLHWYPARPG